VSEQHIAKDTPSPRGAVDLVKVGRADNQAEAEFLQELLSAAGIASVLQRSAGFDVPDLLAAGPRDLLVARSDVEVAREVLQVDGQAPPGTPYVPDPPVRVFAWLVSAVAVVAVVVWLATVLLG
jgi:hypothetical protein